MLQFVFHPAAIITSLCRCTPVAVDRAVSRSALHIAGNRPSITSFKMWAASRLVRLLLADSLGPDLRRIANPDLKPQVCEQSSNQLRARWPPSRSAPALPVADKTSPHRRGHAPGSFPNSPLPVSTELICCQLEMEITPCILFASARFGRSVFSGELDRVSAGGRSLLRRCCSAAWIIDRPPPSFLNAVENLRPREPAYKVGERGCKGRGAEAQSNPVLQGGHMPVAEVGTFAGIDVSAHELSVALRRGQGHDKPAIAKFPNHPSGHKALVACLLRGGGRVRVCLEASGNYSLDLALTLQAHRQVEISVINPRRARRFAESLGERSKTDPVDARVLCEYAARMPWVRWQPPSPVALHLRALTRAIADLGVIHTQQNNRAYAAAASQALPVLVVKEMQRHKKYLEQRMTRLRREAVRLIACDPELDRRFRLMLTTIGIAETSALQILGELAVLPDMLDARQWVAFSGLDPRIFKSGKSVEKRPRISRSGSRHLRRALYMPALVALRRDPYLRVFYQNLLARGKARLQAVVAVMRKLLHALFAMFHSNQPYDGSRLCALRLAVDGVAAYA